MVGLRESVTQAAVRETLEESGIVRGHRDHGIYSDPQGTWSSKACTRIKDPDLNGLRLLRDRLGDRFIGGFVLNLGELAYRKENKIAVMPLSALWSLSARSIS